MDFRWTAELLFKPVLDKLIGDRFGQSRWSIVSSKWHYSGGTRLDGMMRQTTGSAEKVSSMINGKDLQSKLFTFKLCAVAFNRS
jgi:hypothetical protein